MFKFVNWNLVLLPLKTPMFDWMRLNKTKQETIKKRLVCVAGKIHGLTSCQRFHSVESLHHLVKGWGVGQAYLFTKTILTIRQSHVAIFVSRMGSLVAPGSTAVQVAIVCLVLPLPQVNIAKVAHVSNNNRIQNCAGQAQKISNLP